MRTAGPLLCSALIVALLGGCGGSSSSSGERTGSSVQGRSGPSPGAPVGARVQACDSYAVDASRLRSTGVACDLVRRTAAAWLRSPACAPAGASRSACTVRGYRCQATVAGRGVAVGCAAAGRSISFLARHR